MTRAQKVQPDPGDDARDQQLRAKVDGHGRMDARADSDISSETESSEDEWVWEERGPFLAFFLGKKRRRVKRKKTGRTTAQKQRRLKLTLTFTFTLGILVVIGVWALAGPSNLPVLLQIGPPQRGVEITSASVQPEGRLALEIKVAGEAAASRRALDISVEISNGASTVATFALPRWDQGQPSVRPFSLPSSEALRSAVSTWTIRPVVTFEPEPTPTSTRLARLVPWLRLTNPRKHENYGVKVVIYGPRGESLGERLNFWNNNKTFLESGAVRDLAAFEGVNLQAGDRLRVVVTSAHLEAGTQFEGRWGAVVGVRCVFTRKRDGSPPVDIERNCDTTQELTFEHRGGLFQPNDREVVQEFSVVIPNLP